MGGPADPTRPRWASVAPQLDAAMAHHRAGRLDRAEALYRKILNKVPDHPDALHMLGAIATSRGRPQRAIQLIGKVLARYPDFADAHVNLGNAYGRAGQKAEAIVCYRRAIALSPDHALAHSSLGREQTADGDFAGAIASCRRATEIDPAMADGHLHLGIALWRSGRLGAAENALRRALRLDPDNPITLAHLAVVLVELSRFDEARTYQVRLVALQPRDTRAQRALAVSEFRTGDVNAALARFRHVVALDPQFAGGWTSLGWALRALGRFDEAIDCFRRALAIDPDLIEARHSLTATGQLTADPAEIDRLRAILDAPEGDGNARAAAGFALGALLDRADDYDRAFACYAKANGLVRQELIAAGRGYDPRAFSERIDRLVGSFTPEFFAASVGGGSRSELPVFIVGMPRSGTTLVEQIAASHSRIFGAGELIDIGRIATTLPRPAADGETIDRWKADAPALVEVHLARLAALGGGARHRQAARQSAQFGNHSGAVSGCTRDLL
jgi:tetratricopeptide (TPR) repeat protein